MDRKGVNRNIKLYGINEMTSFLSKLTLCTRMRKNNINVQPHWSTVLSEISMTKEGIPGWNYLVCEKWLFFERNLIIKYEYFDEHTDETFQSWKSRITLETHTMKFISTVNSQTKISCHIKEEQLTGDHFMLLFNRPFEFSLPFSKICPEFQKLVI